MHYAAGLGSNIYRTLLLCNHETPNILRALYLVGKWLDHANPKLVCTQESPTLTLDEANAIWETFEDRRPPGRSRAKSVGRNEVTLHPWLTLPLSEILARGSNVCAV